MHPAVIRCTMRVLSTCTAILLILQVFLESTGRLHAQQTLQVVPGWNRYCILDTSGNSILPSGRIVRPAGEYSRVNRAPYGLALTADGAHGVLLHPEAVSIVTFSKQMTVKRLPAYGSTGLPQLRAGTFTGIAITPDSRYAWLSGGNSGMLWKLRLEDGTFIDSIDVGAFHGESPREAFLTDIAITGDGNILALDRAWQQLYCVEPANRKLLYSLPTGYIPFNMDLAADGSKALFCNVGLYQYPLVPGVTKSNKDSLMLRFPPYAAHTSASDTGIWAEGRFIPGLGPANSPNSMSVWMANLKKPGIKEKWNTGRSIGSLLEDGEEVVGGAHPCDIVCGRRFAYISNAQNDFISIIDLKKGRLCGSIPIQSYTFLDRTRGYMPYGLALDEKHGRLYVACMGFNAVAVIDLFQQRCIGFIPTGWGPVKVAIHPKDGSLIVTSARGLGAGPNGGSGFVAPPQGTYVGDIQLGTLQRIPMPDEALLKQYTASVLNNTFLDVKLPETYTPPVKHIVYITKENQTYDEVFGQLKGGLGDSTLSRLGVNCEYLLPDSLRSGADNLRVSPNHHEIARRYAISDNFYCDSDASIHGHHWMLGTIPNEYVETNSAYRGDFGTFSPAPGRRFPRTTGAMDPEDYNEIGGFWEALQRHNKTVYNFGQANEYAGVSEEWNHVDNGARQSVAFPMPAAIYPFTCREYAGYNTNIPDQVRVHQFEKVFREKWLEGKDTMPDVITIQLPNDHGADPRPQDGYPNRASFMGDNDLALGRMLDFLSRTPYWKDMLVIVVEDDAQGGVDHIDAHRSLLMMAGPYVKPGYVSHRHANFGSVIRTMYHLLGIAPVNHYDATASLLTDFFTADTGNQEPFRFLPADPRIFNAALSLEKYNLNTDWMKVAPGPPMDNEDHQRREFYKNKP